MLDKTILISFWINNPAAVNAAAAIIDMMSKNDR